MGPHVKAVLIGLMIIVAIIMLSTFLHAQSSRPVTEQIYCTGTAAPGSLYAYVSIAPGTGTTPVALAPFRCLALDPAVFVVNAAGQLSIKQPAPIAGTTCSPPLAGAMDGAIVYAQLPDKSCLPLVAVADPNVLQGFVGSYQYLFTKIPGIQPAK